MLYLPSQLRMFKIIVETISLYMNLKWLRKWRNMTHALELWSRYVLMNLLVSMHNVFNWKSKYQTICISP